MAVIFPDVEVLLVEYLQTQLDLQATPLAANVRVATQVAPPQITRPAKQVVVNVAPQEVYNYVLQRSTVTIDVYASTYADASNLGLLVAALVPGMSGEQIKEATLRLGPVRTTEETDYERRSLDVELVVKGTDL